MRVLRAVPDDRMMPATRPEVVPGSPDPRRVVRLVCTVGCTVAPGGGPQSGARERRVAGIDALLWLLDEAGFRDGRELRAPGDPGFHVDALCLAEADLGDAPEGPDVRLEARGWFWPPGEPGRTGAPMRPVLRQALLPVALRQASPRLVAGGDAVELTVVVGTAGAMALDADTPPVTQPFGPLAFGLVQAGGRPGAGTLTGGADGGDGWRLVEPDEGSAAVTYLPPDEPTTDHLLVRAAVTVGGEVRLGLELARFPLVVVAP